MDGLWQAACCRCEINFNRCFYTYVPPRALEAIDADLKVVEAEIAALLAEVTH